MARTAARSTSAAGVMQAGRRTYNLVDLGPTECWVLAPLNRPRGPTEWQRWLREGRPIWTSDGPCKPGMLERKIVGRVVGVLG